MIVHSEYMMRRVPIVEARKEFAEMVNRACYGNEVTVVTKHGKDMAAVVPMTHLNAATQNLTKKPAQHAK